MLNPPPPSQLQDCERSGCGRAGLDDAAGVGPVLDGRPYPAAGLNFHARAQQGHLRAGQRRGRHDLHPLADQFGQKQADFGGGGAWR